MTFLGSLLIAFAYAAGASLSDIFKAETFPAGNDERLSWSMMSASGRAKRPRNSNAS